MRFRGAPCGSEVRRAAGDHLLIQGARARGLALLVQQTPQIHLCDQRICVVRPQPHGVYGGRFLIQGAGARGLAVLFQQTSQIHLRSLCFRVPIP